MDKEAGRAKQEKREKKPDTCGYDDNSFPLGRGQKNNKEQEKELWKRRGMKIAAEASKWTQGGERPSGRYTVTLWSISPMNSGKNKSLFLYFAV